MSIASDILDPRSFSRPNLNGLSDQPGTGGGSGGGVTSISSEARIEGAKISHCDTLQVAGRLTDVTLSEIKSLDIAEGGHVQGTVKVDSMRVAGRATGTIEVAGTLTVAETGVVDGTIRYGRISIADGGSITGTLQTAASQ